MSTLRIAFQADDSNRDIAVRAAPAAKEGDFIQVRGEYFQVGRGGFVMKAVRNPPEVLRVEDTSTPRPPRGLPKKVRMLDDAQPLTEFASVTWDPKHLKLPSQGPAVGDRYKPKDPRRPSHAFTVAEVGDGFIRTDKGVTIKLNRLNRYALVP